MPTIVLLKCATVTTKVVEEKSASEEVHRVHLADNSAATATADHALYADKTRTLRAGATTAGIIIADDVTVEVLAVAAHDVEVNEIMTSDEVSPPSII